MKGIITIVIIIAIAIVGFLLLRDGTMEDVDVNDTSEALTDDVGIGDSSDMVVELGDAPADIDTTAEIIVVTYDDGGFTPKEISVSQGQTVRFVNKSSGNMWVASDIHPSHEILPEFDNKKSIGNGENYEFTFTKVGVWKYHNHIKPSSVGTVIVE